MAGYVGELEGRSKGVGRLGDLSGDGSGTSVGIGHHDGVGSCNQVIEVLRSGTVGPVVSVGRGSKGRREVNASVVAPKTGNIHVGKCQGQSVGGLGNGGSDGRSTTNGIHDGNGVRSRG